MLLINYNFFSTYLKLNRTFVSPSASLSTSSSPAAKPVNPVVTYPNADLFKPQIIEDNRNKAGVYR